MPSPYSQLDAQEAKKNIGTLITVLPAANCRWAAIYSSAKGYSSRVRI